MLKRSSSLLAGGVLLSGLSLLASAGAAQAQHTASGDLFWHRTATPNPYKTDALSDVSCVSPGVCVAVGGTGVRSRNERALAMSHTAQGWQASQLPRFRRDAQLQSVSCVPDPQQFCMAVGWKGRVASLAASFDGSTWTRTKSPDTGRFGIFRAVSCTAANDCLMVGNRGHTRQQSHAIAWHWNGHRWRPILVPTHHYSVATAVDCYSTQRCVVVGQANQGQQIRYVSWRWNGGDQLRRLPRLISSDIFGVTCSSANLCYAVGDGVFRYNGFSWQQVESLSGSVLLFDVACSSSSDCDAVGGGYGRRERPRIYHYNGNTWRTARALNLAGSAELDGVDCLQGSCIAVGWASNGARTLAASR